MPFAALPYKTKQFFFVLIKLSIVVGAFYFIYHKLLENENFAFNDFIAFLVTNEPFSTKNMFFLLLLTLFNQYFEILKWKTLVDSICKISFKNALEQSLGSLTASLLTPNRIGEYGAKAIYYASKNRKQILLLNLVGNMMQMSVTILFGIIGLYFFKTQYALDLNYNKIALFSGIIFLIITIIIFSSEQIKFKIKGFLFKKIVRFFKQLPRMLLVKTFLYSVIRYLIFSFQFYYLLLLFGVDLGYANAMMLISCMYLAASIIPSIFIFDVVIKGSVAVYLFSMAGINEFTTLSIVTIMWLFNFVLPSIFGSYYVLNFKLTEATNP